jgi:hypothetical protein
VTAPGDANAAGGPSPLELLHPEGTVRSWASCGAGPGDGLASPRPARPEDEADGCDLVLLSPSRSERRDPGWVGAATRLASKVSADGLVATVRPTQRLLRELREAGLEPTFRLLHVPDVERSRFVVPTPGPQVRFALDSVVPLSSPKRFASRILTVPGTESFAPTSLILRRPLAAPLLGWLAALTPEVPRCSMVLAQSWREGGATIVMRFGDGPGPDLITKVGGYPGDEAEGLRAVAPGAQGARINVPRLVAETELGDWPLLAETPVQGHPAAIEIDGSPRQARQALTTLAGRLRDWQAASAHRRALRPDDVERDLIAPAVRLAAALPDGYVDDLGARAAELIGSEVPFVAAHHDVTAANVMLATGDRIGLIDWEEATLEALPLGDLASAAVDFAAASDRYRDRVAAYRHCFEPGGRFTTLTTELVTAAAGALGIGAEPVRIALEACWLRHADNERAAVADPEEERPFLSIMRRVAAEART